MGERDGKIPEKVLQAARYLVLTQRLPGCAGDENGPAADDFAARIREIEEIDRTGLGQPEAGMPLSELPRT